MRGSNGRDGDAGDAVSTDWLLSTGYILYIQCLKQQTFKQRFIRSWDTGSAKSVA